ncbi:MAG: hypothetical protein KC912_24680 [Proteobacteria bacterium]|nr:hypothetical protein [Pseudomonadota bacterium]
MPALSQREASSAQSQAAKDRASSRGATLQEGSVTSRDGQTMDTLLAPLDVSMAVNPEFEKDATSFETALGVDAFSRALPAAEAMSAKAKDYFVAKHGAWQADNAELEASLTRLGADNAGWSGAVGTAMTDLMAVFDTGNLATRMNHIGGFVTKILGADLLADDPAMDTWIEKAKLDEDELDARRAAQTGNAWTTMVQKPTDSEVQGQGVARDKSGEDARTSLTPDSSGVTLDPAEQALQQRGVEAKGEVWDPNTSTLCWEEGARTWAVNENNAWVAKMRELSMPLAAGPSGTTNMLMNAAQVLGGVSMDDARLAAIGYLVPANHHSLVEVMVAAQPFGPSYSEGQQMYTDISPYNEGQLRAFGGGKFPHERHPGAVA